MGHLSTIHRIKKDGQNEWSRPHKNKENIYIYGCARARARCRNVQSGPRNGLARAALGWHFDAHDGKLMIKRHSNGKVRNSIAALYECVFFQKKISHTVLQP